MDEDSGITAIGSSVIICKDPDQERAFGIIDGKYGFFEGDDAAGILYEWVEVTGLKDYQTIAGVAAADESYLQELS